MKTFLLKSLVLVFLSVISTTSAIARDNYFVFDLINNQTFTYQQNYVELENSKWNFYESIDVSFPYFTQLPNATVQDKINSRIREIMIGQLASDVFKVKLFNHLNEVVDTYLELYNKKIDRLGYYSDNQYKFTPDLEDVEYKFVSCYNNVVAMAVNFEYSTSIRNKKLLEGINYCQLYYFDVLTGKEYTSSDIYKPSAKEKIEKLIIKASQENMAFVDKEYIRKNVFGESDYRSRGYGYYNRDYDGGYESVIKPDLKRLKDTLKTGLVNFNYAKNGFSFFKAFSMSYFIPAYQACTKKMFGYSMETRLSLDQIREYLNPLGPYGSLIGFKVPQTDIYKNKNNPLYPPIRFSRIRNLGISSNLPYLLKDTLVTLVQETRPDNQRRKNGERFDTIELIRELVYEKGKLLEIRSYSSSRLYAELFFAYDSKGNLIKSTQQKKGELVSSTDYKYDAQNNLIQKNVSDNEEPMKKFYYSYSKQFVLEERYGTVHYDDEIDNGYTKTYLNSNASPDSIFYTPLGKYTKYYYKHGSNGKLLYGYKDPSRQEQRNNYIYDSTGRLMGYEYDNSRYLTYWEYDSAGNIVREVVQDGLKQQRCNLLTYDSKGHVTKVETTQPQYGRSGNSRRYTYFYK